MYLFIALSVYNEVPNQSASIKQIPAIHYHLGSLRAMLWGYYLQQNKNSTEASLEIEKNLEQSMYHYRYEFF